MAKTTDDDNQQMDIGKNAETMGILLWAEEMNHIYVPSPEEYVAMLRDQQGAVMDNAETILRGDYGLNPPTEGLSMKKFLWGGEYYG